MAGETGTTMKLRDMATTIRSKNAGVDHVTFDIIFREPRYYEAAKRSEALTPQRIAELYRIPVEDVVSFVAFDPAQAIKFTIRRRRPAGSPGEPDTFGSQMYPPLFGIEIAVDDAD
ncbi:DUF4387 domain-containing protein [Sphaerobacter sp.]|uniref:DUF4387 domain-containing protein n=1 Tax=Sphaerobacter sp. TaxID=2099654 RepID=UPI001D94526B|nr:DUF4387 domain-containing protein [Sphaerobacter sp.]MBX5445692.1 DUF4387 domain-containing protein [Sphaerobacter sp.]